MPNENKIGSCLRHLIFASLLLSARETVFASLPTKIYVFCGQSNIAVPVSESYLRVNQPQMYNWFHSRQNDIPLYWCLAADSVEYSRDGILAGQDSLIGIESICAYYLNLYWKSVDPSQRIAVIKVFKGGSSIRYWTPAEIALRSDSSTEPLGHRQLRQRIDYAIRQLSMHGGTCEGAGVFWYQGEYEGLTLAQCDQAQEYEQSLKMLVNGLRDYQEPVKGSTNPVPSAGASHFGLRQLLGTKSIPFVAAQIHWYSYSTYNSLLVRNATRSFVRSQEASPATWVTTDDLSLRDLIHIDEKSVIELGRKFAEAYLSLLDSTQVRPPDINPAVPFFGESQEITIAGDPSGITRYTLDGTDPAETSQEYISPIVIRSTTTIRAATWSPGATRSAIQAAKFTRIEPNESHIPISLQEGLNYTVFTGINEQKTSLDLYKVTRSGIARSLLPSDIPGLPASHFAIRWSGYIRVPTTDRYRFQIDCGAYSRRDRTRLIINDIIVVPQLDSILFSGWPPRTAALSQGLHRFVVEYTNFSGKRELKFSFGGASVNPAETMSAVLFNGSATPPAPQPFIRQHAHRQIFITAPANSRISIVSLDGRTLWNENVSREASVYLSGSRLAQGCHVFRLAGPSKSRLEKLLSVR